MRGVMCGVLLLAACSRDITAPRAALLVTASVSRTSFRAGDTVTVLVTVFNRGNKPQTIGGSGCGLLGFEVTTQDGSVVGPNSVVCSLILILKTLAPGEQFSLAKSWNGSALGDGAVSPIGMLPSGTYFVVGTVDPIAPDGSFETPPVMDHVPAVVSITR